MSGRAKFGNNSDFARRYGGHKSASTSCLYPFCENVYNRPVGVQRGAGRGCVYATGCSGDDPRTQFGREFAELLSPRNTAFTCIARAAEAERRRSEGFHMPGDP